MPGDIDTLAFAELVERFGLIADRWEAAADQVFDWAAGAATGGPEGDGRYPFTKGAVTVLATGPAKAALGGLDLEAAPLVCFGDAAVVSPGTRLARFVFPFAAVIEEVFADLGSASLAGPLTMDVKIGDASILSTKITIGAGQRFSSAGGVAQPVLSTTAVAKYDEATVDVLGAGMGAKGLRVTIIFRNTA